MRNIITILVIFAVHHGVTEIIINGVTENEKQLDSRRNSGTPPTFYFIQEEVSG